MRRASGFGLRLLLKAVWPFRAEGLMVSRRFREPELCGFDSRLPDYDGPLGLCSRIEDLTVSFAVWV